VVIAILTQMPGENCDLLRDWFAATARRDASKLLEIASPEIEYVPIMAAFEGRVYRGHEGICRWLDELYEYWDVFEPVGHEFHERGDTVIALGCWNARGKVSGAQLDSEPATWIVEFQDGKMTRLQTYTSREEAFREIGIKSSDELYRCR
jgi:ketosteroid isomerase-like protein